MENTIFRINGNLIEACYKERIVIRTEWKMFQIISHRIPGLKKDWKQRYIEGESLNSNYHYTLTGEPFEINLASQKTPPNV